MPKNDIDLLSIDRGMVTAPAGCGKTHLIAEALIRHTDAKPILVLTHTNAGVVALRERLDRAGVPAKAYRLSTIDGWAMRLISTFPARSAHNPDILKLANPAGDYLDIRNSAAKLLTEGHVSDILVASYARLIVDEYQDCSIRQHSLVAWAAQILPTCVLGDPMQAIFGFGNDGLAKWEDVCAFFELAGELTTPWRWINANAKPMGIWLLEVRAKLLRGEPIDLSEAPAAVSWVELDGTQDHQKRLDAARVRPPGGKGCVLIIGDSISPNSQRQFASQTPGAVTVEAVDLKDLIVFARNFNLTAPDILKQLAQFAQGVMTNVSAADLVQRVQSLASGTTTARTATDVEQAALIFIRAPSHHAAVDLLVEIGKEGGVRTHRPAVLRACIKALQMCDGTEGSTFYDAAIRMREQTRHIGRPLPRRAVGSTLLLKGLEAEATVILNAGSLDARNLYVAMTRGSKALWVCSATHILTPRL